MFTTMLNLFSTLPQHATSSIDRLVFFREILEQHIPHSKDSLWNVLYQKYVRNSIWIFKRNFNLEFFMQKLSQNVFYYYYERIVV